MGDSGKQREKCSWRFAHEDANHNPVDWRNEESSSKVVKEQTGSRPKVNCEQKSASVIQSGTTR